MKHRNFVLNNAPIEKKDNLGQAFLLHLQKAILLSLEKRGLITSFERETCIEKLEKQDSARL